MIKELLYLILLVLGFPSGIYLAKVCKEEIKKWRGRMIFICAICFIGSVILLNSSFEYRIPFVIDLLFMIITFLTIVWKSYN